MKKAYSINLTYWMPQTNLYVSTWILPMSCKKMPHPCYGYTTGCFVHASWNYVKTKIAQKKNRQPSNCFVTVYWEWWTNVKVIPHSTFIPIRLYGAAALYALMWQEDGRTPLPTLFIQEEALSILPSNWTANRRCKYTLNLAKNIILPFAPLIWAQWKWYEITRNCKITKKWVLHFPSPKPPLRWQVSRRHSQQNPTLL